MGNAMQKSSQSNITGWNVVVVAIALIMLVIAILAPVTQPQVTPTPIVPDPVPSVPAALATGFACDPSYCGEFADVEPDEPFYFWAHCLACRNIMPGYPCGTDLGEARDCKNSPFFHAATFVTRGELAMIVSMSAGLSDAPGAQVFADVPPDTEFYAYINRLAHRGYLAGYPCGRSGEPCDDENRPYYRPVKFITRGEAAKMVTSAAGFNEGHGEQTFQDMKPQEVSGFYIWVQRLASRDILSGYTCGELNPQTGEALPCVA